MCGRYGITSDEREIMSRFQLGKTVAQLPLSFNVTPGMTMPVVMMDGLRSLAMMRWGLVPHWAKDPQSGYKTINARAETVAEKPAYRKAFRSQRCLVPASGFYEWKQTGQGKVPHWIRLRDGELLAFAGLWDCWQDPDGGEVHTYTILTCEPNELMAPIHNRMPVIIGRDDEDLWLDPGETDVARLTPLLRPYEASALETWPVSQAVNNPANDHPGLLERAELV